MYTSRWTVSSPRCRIGNVVDGLKAHCLRDVTSAQLNYGIAELDSRSGSDSGPVLRKLGFGKETKDGMPMSKIATWWLFRGKREFPFPYVICTNTTKSTTLSKDGWSSWYVGRIDEVLSNKHDKLWVSSQLQVYGGTDLMFQRNADGTTSYSFRDATLGRTCDVFYEGTREAAEQCQAENDKGIPIYFKEDRRVLWGSYGDWNMRNVWQNYYEPYTYRKLQNIRKQADPNGLFTPNPFCVESAD